MLIAPLRRQPKLTREFAKEGRPGRSERSGGRFANRLLQGFNESFGCARTKSERLHYPQSCRRFRQCKNRLALCLIHLGFCLVSRPVRQALALDTLKS
ncbi:MAG: hypothetical protein WAM99_10325, partial [Xanthobacteraceae bacterium]